MLELLLFDLALLIAGGVIAVNGLTSSVTNSNRVALGIAMIAISICLLVLLYVMIA